MKRLTRAEIAQETLEIFKKGYYEKETHRIEVKEALSSAIAHTTLYTPEEFDSLPIPANQYATRFEVYNETTFAGARRWVEEEGIQDVVCLNFASAKNPGGGFLNGSQAQEESLARASGMYLCQITKPEMYEANRKGSSCLYLDHMIYSRDVPVIRDDADHLLDQIYKVSILTAPAVNIGCLKQHGDEEGLRQAEEYMLRRTERVLKVCAHQGHTHLVLGAWGCGVFQNDPVKVASYFSHFLQGKFKNTFQRVVFSVLDHQKKGTFEAFQSAFGDKDN